MGVQFLEGVFFCYSCMISMCISAVCSRETKNFHLHVVSPGNPLKGARRSSIDSQFNPSTIRFISGDNSSRRPLVGLGVCICIKLM